jgi:SagB-type dehydrogenase family enzyme
MKESPTETYRYFLKDSVRLTIDFSRTDQNKGVSPPPIEKPFEKDRERIDLIPGDSWKNIAPVELVSAILNRRSHRKFLDEPLVLEDLSFLLWAGCRHALETYLCVLNITGLKTGIYRYLPVEHQLILESTVEGLREKIIMATLGQSFIGTAPVTFIWTTIPYRMEWRYDIAAHKVILLDAGHACQNLYLACSAIGAGTCAVAAYNQSVTDQLLGVDGKDEFTVYLAPVGKI